jgi:capping protein (actin filament) muscle Z-line, beta
MTTVNKVASSLALMRRLPPNNIEQNLTGLLNLCPEESDELLQRIDQPLEEDFDVESGRKFLKCDYNRDGDSYRSPWSNQYSPPLDDAFYPSEQLRAIEQDANEIFDAYRELYFEGGTSSVYLWELDTGFAGCFLIKKAIDMSTGTAYVKSGSWDSIHIVEVTEESPVKATYKLTTTIMLYMVVENEIVGESNLAGSLTRQLEQSHAVGGGGSSHVANIGKMIEQMESDLRVNMNELYLLKTRQIVNSIRTLTDGPVQTAQHTTALKIAVMGKKPPAL